MPEPISKLSSQVEEARDFAVAAARLADEMRCEDVVVLDMRGLSSLADFFIIATGTSERQMHALLDRLVELGREHGRRPLTSPDVRSGAWVLADYVDVIVHIFDSERRQYYDLDSLWGDAPQIDWRPQAVGAGVSIAGEGGSA